MTPNNEDDLRLLLHAALDGELDAIGALKVERALAEDPDLAAEHARLETLRESIRIHAPRETTPAALRERLLAQASADHANVSRINESRAGSWRSYAAAIAATILVTLGAQHITAQITAPDPTLQSLVFAHMRGQISGQPTDVVSTDRHTVKPWLAGKLPVAALVLDLSNAGFPLLGGRIDVVGGDAVPTLVYKKRDHLISLTQLRRAQEDFPSAPVRREQNGYPTVVWSDGDRSFVAVSDLAPADLASFARAFRDAAARER